MAAPSDLVHDGRPASMRKKPPRLTATTSSLLGCLMAGTVGRNWCSAEEVGMGVLVILEMDGPTDVLLAAASDLEARRPTPAILARMVAPTDSGVVVATFWESAAARDDYQAQPEHSEALRASGLLEAVADMRSRVFEDADLSVQ
jgi:hypothetical protein